MKSLIKPDMLKKGDTLATISLSWGGANKFQKRYQQGKHQFEEAFGVSLIETKHALSSPEDLYNHPEWRLSDLMDAFEDKDIKGIICNIGGDDTIRLLRHMTEKHFQTIHDNPKIFLGFSDTTVNHMMCLKAGLASFHSACVMFGYAENGGIPNIMVQNTCNTLFKKEPVGILPESSEYIVDRVTWGDDHIVRPRTQTTPWRYIQGDKTVTGRLIGGCFDSLMECINGTSLFPKLEYFDNAILFLENSEDQPTPETTGLFLRTLGAMGILERLRGILFAKPGGEFFPEEKSQKEQWLKKYPEFDDILLKICKEYDRTDLAIVTNMDFGHTVPQLILPYGVLAEINPRARTVSLLESAVK
jgi:muramoyltetrapeptide carboxypeptidase LdcA involved in peptidoglycan recycling